VSVLQIAVTPVEVLRSVIVAPAITEPEGSRTVPSTVAVSN